MANVVKNKSKGYGYTYSSLADLADAGIDIPVMRTKATEFGEYVEWLDDKGEWQQGAKVVQMEMKGMNDAQAYGSALTYARRYTVQMAMQVACDDDKAVENAKPVAKTSSSKGLDFESIKALLANMTTTAEIDNFAKDVARKHPNMTEKQKAFVTVLFNNARADIEIK